MTYLTLPNDQTGLLYYDFACQLDGKTYIFTFRWNDRANGWFMSIDDADGNPLLYGRRVVLGVFLWGRFMDPALPPGQLRAVDTTGADLEAGVSDLGGRVELRYVSAASPGQPRFPGAGA